MSTDPTRLIAGCVSSWEMTQAAAEWIGVQCDSPMAALYLSEAGRGQVLRGLHRSAGTSATTPSRLWWKGSAGWVSAEAESLLVVPWTLGPQSGLIVVGPFAPGPGREQATEKVETALRTLIVPLVSGLQRYESTRGPETNLLEAVAYQVGAGLAHSDAMLIDAIREQTLAEHVELVDGRVIVSGALAEPSAAVAAVEGWLGLIPDAENDQERSLVMLHALADMVDVRLPETVGRSARVAEWAVRIGGQLGVEAKGLAVIREVARLQRVGRALTGVGPDANASGPGSMSSIGASLLAGAGRPLEVVEALAQVGERWDGQGSGGAEGTDIPLAARIVAVASAWVDRTGGGRWAEVAQDELAARSIVSGACRLFDPLVVSALLEETDASAAV